MKYLLAAVVVLSPGAVVANECGWCGSEAQALGRALALGGDVACACPEADRSNRAIEYGVQPVPRVDQMRREDREKRRVVDPPIPAVTPRHKT